MGEAKWIWDEEVVQENSNKHIICYFRKRFYLKKKNCRFYINVTADSRYKLYLNGYLIGFGPEKGDRWRHYVDTIEIKSNYLKKGWNVISSMVIHYYIPEPWIYKRGGPGSVFRTATAGYFLEGYIFDKKGNLIEKITTDESWKVYRDKSITFIPSNYMPLVGEVEKVEGIKRPYGWIYEEFDDTNWDNAKIIFKEREVAFDPEEVLNGTLPNWPTIKRDIPMLIFRERKFKKIMPSSFTFGIALQPRRSYSFLLDAGEIITAFPYIKVKGGEKSVIKLTYGECFLIRSTNGRLIKERRDDTNGFIVGDTDIFLPSGKDDFYEPFWFRTFRYIKMDIDTSSSPLIIEQVGLKEIEYPLKIEGTFKCSKGKFNKVWKVSLRTLKRCMHETYEDCPYYEQMQYIMDSMLEALYTYQISTDYSLAKKALYDFHSSLLPNGLLQSRYPSVAPQVIPIFSLYWILMLRDYVMYSGEIGLIKRYRSTIDSIIGWFERKLTKNYLIGKVGYWPYVDWVKGWEWGVPPSFYNDIATIYSLIYSYTLKEASNLMLIINTKSLFKEYRKISLRIDKAVMKYCWDEKEKMLKDGIKTNQFSQHCQIWGILNGIIKGRKAIDAIEKTFKNKNINEVSISHSYFLFRALEKCGLYNKYAPLLLNKWEKLLDMNVTTFPEIFENPRSECHGWSAVPLYEFTSSILGIKPIAPGFDKVEIKPHPVNLNWAEGKIPTLKGEIGVKWEKDDNSILLCIWSPNNMQIKLTLTAFEISTAKIIINGKEIKKFKNSLELPGGKYKILLKV